LKNTAIQHYVKLKENHTLKQQEAKQVKKMELLTQEERWPFPDDKNTFDKSHLIEVYKIGTEQECQDFIKNIEEVDLKTQFEVIKC